MLLSIFLIFLCIHTSFGYIYPLSSQAQDVIRQITASTKRLCSLACWMDWLLPIEPEREVTYIDSWLIWMGFKDEPINVVSDERYYFCTALALIIFAIGYTIYVTASKHFNGEKIPIDTLVPYAHNDSTDDESVTSYTYSKCFCECNLQLSGNGDMKI